VIKPTLCLKDPRMCNGVNWGRHSQGNKNAQKGIVMRARLEVVGTQGKWGETSVL